MEVDELKKKHMDSQKFRQKFLNKYDGMLNSVWDVKYDSTFENKDIAGQNKRTEDLVKEKKMGMLTPFLATSYKSVRHKDKFGVSKFPKNICKRIVKFYSEKGQWILDPCAGHNSRMQTCYELERNYIGYDISKDYMMLNTKIRFSLLNPAERLAVNDSKIILRLQNSQFLIEADDSIDFIFTSPPYWDIEYYGDEPEQYGHKKDYGEYLFSLGMMIGECWRVLKVNKYCLINVNDFRKDGKFFPLHRDIIDLCEEAGFTLHDIIIMKYPSSMQSCFATQLEERKHTAKIHEYLLVFKKKMEG